MKRSLLAGLSIAVVAVAVIVLIANLRADREREPAPTPETSRYSESPMLRERVERGELPPVEDRLPDEPLVVTSPEGVGRYDSEPVESQD